MSGYLTPKSYLWTEFNLNIESDDTISSVNKIFSGDHNKSVRGIMSGEYHCASVYVEILKDQFEKDMDKFQVLYLSPEIPFNAYIINKNLDSSLKTLIKNAFKGLESDVTDLGKRVKSNSLKITGWKECNSEEYYEKIKPSLNIIHSRLPKPYLLLDNIASIPEYKENLNEIIRIVKSKLSQINAWEILENNEIHEYGDRHHIKLNSFKYAYGKEPKIFISGYVKEGNIEKQIFNFCPDSVSGDVNKIVKVILDNILIYIAPKLKIYDDYKGLFINMGKENGLTNCELYLDDGNFIEPANYSIENTRTVFLFKKPEENNLYRDKIIKVKYILF